MPIVVPRFAVVGIRPKRDNRRAADTADRLGLQRIDRKRDMVRIFGKSRQEIMGWLAVSARRSAPAERCRNVDRAYLYSEAVWTKLGQTLQIAS